jgi:hypothetical protein
MLLLNASVAFAAAPSEVPGEEASKPWEADLGLQAMARLQPGLQRNHVALYFGGEITGQGLGLPSQEAMEAAFPGESSLALTFRLPTLPEPLHLTVPRRGVGVYPVGPGAPGRAEFAGEQNLEGFIHFDRLDAVALSGWFFLRVRSATGDTLQTFGGAFREISP